LSRAAFSGRGHRSFPFPFSLRCLPTAALVFAVCSSSRVAKQTAKDGAADSERKMKSRKETIMKKQQTTRTEKKTEAPAQSRSANSELAEIILGMPRIRTSSIRTLALVTKAFQAESLHMEPATPRTYNPPTPDEYEQALCEA
jgi:hypothetical protein